MECDFVIEREDSRFECPKCGYIIEAKYRNAKRKCEPLIQPQYEPTLLKKIGHFSWALARHLYKGVPTVTQEELDRRLAICQECPLLKKNGLVGGVCTHESCGCTIQDEVVFLNKIAWADEKCPLDKWKEEKGV